MLATDAKSHRAIARFAARGENYQWFAAHAAVPLALTTELLYGLWAEFRQDEAGATLDVPWVVVADLLFSGLCTEVGHELYELRPEVRSRLLEQLQTEARFGATRVAAVGRFVWAYGEARLQSEDPDAQDLAQVWAWSGQAFCEPEGAARSLVAALGQEQAAASGDVVRLAQVVEGLREPLKGFPEVGMYARGLRALEFGEVAAAQQDFERLKLHQRHSESCLPFALPEFEPEAEEQAVHTLSIQEQIQSWLKSAWLRRLFAGGLVLTTVLVVAYLLGPRMKSVEPVATVTEVSPDISEEPAEPNPEPLSDGPGEPTEQEPDSEQPSDFDNASPDFQLPESSGNLPDFDFEKFFPDLRLSNLFSDQPQRTFEQPRNPEQPNISNQPSEVVGTNPSAGGSSSDNSGQREESTTTSSPIETEKIPDSTSSLRLNSKGPAVAELQTLLRNLGYTIRFGANGSGRGTFGQQTLTAVRAFQRDVGLAVDGVVGPQTMAVLRGEENTRPRPVASSSGAIGKYTVATNSTRGLNVRTGSGSQYGIAGTLANGTGVNVSAMSNGWAQIAPGRYVMAQFLRKQGGSSDNPEEFKLTERRCAYTITSAQLYEAPSSSSASLYLIERDDIFEILDVDQNWARIRVLSDDASQVGGFIGIENIGAISTCNINPEDNEG